MQTFNVPELFMEGVVVVVIIW